MKFLDAFLQKALTACACYYLAVFCVLGAARMTFPGSLEWLESSMYYQMLRVLAGQALYVEPSIEYIPAIYPPLYMYTAAMLACITGPGFATLRIISFGSTLASMALIGFIVCRETRSCASGLWAAGFFAATYVASATYFDVGRIDPLFLALFLGSLTAIRFAPGMQGCGLSALLLAAAALTKQTALILGVPLLLYAFVFRQRAQAFCFTGLFIAAVGLITLQLNAASNGWYFFYTLELPRQHPVLWHRFGSFWLGQIMAPLGIAACLTVSYFFLIPLRKSRGPALLYALCVMAMLAASCTPWMKLGGFKNVLIPAHAALAIGAGLALGAGAGRSSAVRLLCCSAALIQFCLLWYNPLALLPAPGSADVCRQSVAAIKNIDGEVFAPASGYLCVMAGKTHSAHISYINDILFARPGAVRDRLIMEIRNAIRNKRFAAILLDRRFEFFQRDIEAHYVLYPQYAEQLTYWPLIKYWYIPRPTQS